MKKAVFLSFLGLSVGLLSGFGANNPPSTPSANYGASSFVPDDHIGSIVTSGATVPGLEPCGRIPASTQSAFQKAQSYLANCPLIAVSRSKPIVINDYAAGRPYTYVFQGTRCIGKTPVSWGGGYGKTRNNPLPCSDDGSRMTPPGFHLATVAVGAKYNSSNAIGMMSLDGQGSFRRYVVMHGASYPPGGYSWGCPAVSQPAIKTLKSIIPTGSLIYNHFGSKGLAPGCKSRAGLNPDPRQCRVESSGGPKRRLGPRRIVR